MTDTPDRRAEERERHDEAKGRVGQIDRSASESIDGVWTPHQQGQGETHEEAEEGCHVRIAGVRWQAKEQPSKGRSSVGDESGNPEGIAKPIIEQSKPQFA